jgi:hypothetical protein
MTTDLDQSPRDEATLIVARTALGFKADGDCDDDGAPTADTKNQQNLVGNGGEEEDTDEISTSQHPCKFCDAFPCVLDQGLYTSLNMEYDDRLRDTCLTNGQIRFYLYRHASSWIHGYLGKGIRRELPQCVRDLIRSLSPDPDGNYVGFLSKKRKKDHDHLPNPQEYN